jgi:hypothetical protein
MIKHDDNNGDKNNENARSSALPYLVVYVQKKVVLNLCALSEKHVGPSFGKTNMNEFYDLGLQTLLLNKTAFFSSSWKKEQQKNEAKNGRKQRN